VRFKNTRKGFFRNVNKLLLSTGDIIAVESSPGHDMGIVSLRGELVLEQMKKYNVSPGDESLKKIYRKAKPADIDKWKEAIALEIPTMLRAREITELMKLNMKIGDVEYQGDKTKAIFYYIAEERVDFRELIKVLAEEFRVRIEMRQVGARQEAGRIGGIGACGRQLCCSSWLTNFHNCNYQCSQIAGDFPQSAKTCRPVQQT
jgi:cell fate regulator YaaT (PSP1 superfamily)